MWSTDASLQVYNGFFKFFFIHTKYKGIKPSNFWNAYSGFLFFIPQYWSILSYLFYIVMFAHILDDRSFESIILWSLCKAIDNTKTVVKEVSNGHSVHAYKIWYLVLRPSPRISPSFMDVAKINESPIAITRDKCSV